MIAVDFWSVPRCWPGETVAVFGGNPSLTQEQVDACRGRCRAIALNRAYVLAPWADWLFGSEAGKFWDWCSGPRRVNPTEPDALDFAGTKIVLRCGRARERLPVLAAAGVKVLRHSLEHGLSDDPSEARGTHAAEHVLSIIHHTGAVRVLLLGIGARPGHWHASWPDGECGPHVHQLRMVRLRARAAELAKLGIEVSFDTL